MPHAKRFFRLTAVLLCLALFLTGCMKGTPSGQNSSGMLPPVQLPYSPPGGHETAQKEVTVQLFLPDSQNTRLTALHQKAELNPFAWYGETLVNALFSYRSDPHFFLPRTDSLALLGPIEVSNGIATVNLSPQALSLSHEQLYIVFQSVTNALCQFNDIHAVNLLIGSMQPGIDAASRIPAGALQKNHTDDLNTLIGRMTAQKNTAEATGRLTQTVTLYFPSFLGQGIVSENRVLAFHSAAPGEMAKTLLDALSRGSDTMENLPRYPSLGSRLSQNPAVREHNGEKILTLCFSGALRQELSQSGITPSCMAASLVYTMTTYLPGIAGVEIYMDQEKITSVTAENSGETLYFQDGMMKRGQFADFLLTPCTLYFANERGTLTAAKRLVPYQDALHPAFLLRQLLKGPQMYDRAKEKILPVLPPLTPNDILGTGYHGNGTVTVNLTARVPDLCQNMTADQERRMVYAMVNTLTELKGVYEVCFFINGRQPEFFAHTISLPGTFLRNPDIISD